eukprot:scaffold71228_cov20-Tisochrysis_lutea.AAC.2
MGRFTLVAMQVVPQHKTLPPCPCSCLIPDAGLQIMPRSFSPNYRLLAAAAGTRMAKAGVDTWHRCGHMAGYMHMVQVWARGRRWEYDTGVATWQGKRYKCCSTAERHYSWGCQPLMYATSRKFGTTRIHAWLLSCSTAGKGLQYPVHHATCTNGRAGAKVAAGSAQECSLTGLKN